MAVPIYGDLQRKGFRACLSGVGGDQWLDRARQAGLRQRIVAALERYPTLLAATRRALGKNGLPDWIPGEFAARVGLDGRLAQRPSRHRFRSLPQRWQHALLTDGHEVHALEMTDRLAARFGLEPRYPFEDRRLVEFALPLPDSLHRDGEAGKVLLRAAMSELLPPAVRDRPSKADFTHLFVAAVEQAAKTFEAPAIGAQGWVKAPVMRAMSQSCVERPWPPWFTLGIETWYRALSPGRGPNEPTV